FHEKGTFENEDMINSTIYHETLNEMHLAVVGGALIQIVLFAMTFWTKRDYGGLVDYYRALYVGLFVLMLISRLIIEYVKNDYENRSVKLLWISPIVALFIISGALCATVLDAYVCGFANPCVYLLVALFVPVVIYMDPKMFIVLTLLTDSVMLAEYHHLRGILPSPSPSTVAFGACLFLKAVVGLVIMFMKFSYRENNISNEQQKKEIRDLNNAQNRFFSSMSHEIRTPINTIIGLNEMILREKVSDEVAEDAANIRAASNMLLHLINDILDMSKISSGQMKLTNVVYRPGDMLSEIVGMLWMRCKEKGLEFHVEISPDMPSELYGDEVRVKQILINVLNNAIKYTKKGSVTLSIQCNGINDGKADIVYTVTDTGIGIKKENIPHLFTAFKRVDEEKNRFIEGTGLGLSIVRELTDLMGGTISVNSVYTQGSTFIIEIPQTVTDYSSIGNVNFEDKHKFNTSGSYRSSFEAPEAKVLVVDDNESNLMVLRKLLRDTKVAVDTVDSGEKALKMTLEKSYNVIFMDHLMPEMDGIECLHKIKDQIGGISKDAKVIALTANAGSEMKKLYADEGFDGYLVKPVTASELESELVRVLPPNIVTIIHSDENILENSMSWLDTHRKKRVIAISTESVADIPQSLLDEYRIAVIPHKVETQNGIFADGEEIDSEGLLDFMADGKPVRTHAPSSKEFEEFFAKAISDANNVIHLNISSKVNNSGYDDAKEGAAAFNNVTVFDTRHLSSGQGIIVLEACKMAAAGLSVTEITGKLEKLRKYVHTSFIVDDLDYLARSGQVSSRLARIGNSMMFHPVIDMKNGKMCTYRFYFGSRLRAWSRYVSSTLSPVSEIDKSVLFVTYVGLTQKDLDVITKLVEKKVQFEKIYFQKASPTIAVNSGPGTFGLLYRKKTDILQEDR
ncbi:MAG: DegV family EDD domain-containing protein, partial [Lachnospiraceae bacterium]|nr:DegV family EDD domain-containing protein [Lachnospiraceae bacterium]